MFNLKFCQNYPAATFEIEVERPNSHYYIFKHNLTKKFGISDLESYKLIESTFFSLIRKFQSLEIMNELGGILPSREIDMGEVSEWIQKTMQPKFAVNPDETLATVLKISGFPDLNDPNILQKIDFRRLLDIRNEPEITDFREFIFNNDDKSEQELDENLNSFKNKISYLWTNNSISLIRLLVTSSVFSPAVGIGYSLLESFVIDKFLIKNNTFSFLNDEMPKLFVDTA
jgi:hypothetical protein